MNLVHPYRIPAELPAELPPQPRRKCSLPKYHHGLHEAHDFGKITAIWRNKACDCIGVKVEEHVRRIVREHIENAGEEIQVSRRPPTFGVPETWYCKDDCYFCYGDCLGGNKYTGTSACASCEIQRSKRCNAVPFDTESKPTIISWLKHSSKSFSNRILAFHIK